MNIKESYTAKLTARASRKTWKPSSLEQAIAAEIYEAFGHKLKYPLLLKMIREKGVIFIRSTFQEIQNSKGVRNAAGLFIFKVKETKVEMREVKTKTK